MAITKKPGRQWPLVAKVPFAFADFGASGVAEPALDLPAGASVIAASLTITTVFDSVTSDAIDLAGGGVTLSAVDGQVLGSTADTTIDSTALTVLTTLTIEWTGVGGSTANGAGFALVEYIINDRSTEVQPV